MKRGFRRVHVWIWLGLMVLIGLAFLARWRSSPDFVQPNPYPSIKEQEVK